MKRPHLQLAVEDRVASIKFYSILFAVEPTVTNVDCAKWMLDDPRGKPPISARAATAVLNPLGVQIESAASAAAAELFHSSRTHRG